jgi:hypothetical protein
MTKNITLIIVISMLIFVVVSNGMADIYSWVDDDGVRHFSDTRVGSDGKKEVSVQKEKKYKANDNLNGKKDTPESTKIVEKPAEKVPEKEISPEEKERIDREIRATWNKMKNELQRIK